MKKTPEGTKALVKRYLKEQEGSHNRGLWIEAEISRRIGHGNAVVLDGYVILAFHDQNFESPLLRDFIFVGKRVTLDESLELPEVPTPFDDIEPGPEDEIPLDPPPKEEKKKEKKEKKGRHKASKTPIEPDVL